MMRPVVLRDDGREHGERAVVERRRAERDLRAIEVDVVAGTQLGQPMLAGAEAERRRRADRQLVERDARLAPRGRAVDVRISASCCAMARRSSSDAA